MGLLSRFRRRKPASAGGGAGAGPAVEYDAPEFEQTDAAETGAGGSGYYEAEIAKYRWIAEAEATNLARADLDPLDWRGGEMAFDHERGIAHAHEALRDKLANRVADQVAENAGALYERAADVAAAREKLHRVDNALVRVTRDFKKLYEDLRHDPLELGRYYRLSSKSTQDTKKLIAFVFIVSEFIISGFVFERMIPSEIPFLGYFFALGLMLLLIIVPHYTAQGLKEGVTRYHKFDQRWAKDNRKKVHPDLARRVDYEEMDDKGFRLAAAVVGMVLVALILPMSVLRAHEIPTTISKTLLFVFFLLLQLGISGYFFLREWLDHGMASHNLFKLAEQKEALEYDRLFIYEGEYAYAVQEFHRQAEDLIFVLTQAPRWDSYIVQECMATIRLFRHHVMLGHNDLAPFLTWARVPYLGSRESVEAGRADGYPIDPLSNEHVVLDERNTMGREWWMRTAGEALAKLPRPRPRSDADGVGADGAPPVGRASTTEEDDVSWFISRSPWVLLDEFLGRYFDRDAHYVRPRELDVEEDLPSDEELTRNEPEELLTEEVPADDGFEGAAPVGGDPASEAGPGDSSGLEPHDLIVDDERPDQSEQVIPQEDVTSEDAASLDGLEAQTVQDQFEGQSEGQAPGTVVDAAPADETAPSSTSETPSGSDDVGTTAPDAVSLDDSAAVVDPSPVGASPDGAASHGATSPEVDLTEAETASNGSEPEPVAVSSPAVGSEDS